MKPAEKLAIRTAQQRSRFFDDLGGRAILSLNVLTVCLPFLLPLSMATTHAYHVLYAHRVAADWNATDGTLVTIHFEDDQDPIVAYDYEVNGETFRSTTFSEAVCNASMHWAKSEFGHWRSIVGESGQLQVYYDSENPGRACLYRSAEPAYPAVAVIVFLLAIVGVFISLPTFFWIEFFCTLFFSSTKHHSPEPETACAHSTNVEIAANK